MTDREKAIVMAYTGISMLTGDKFQIFHEYIEHIMGRPVMTHELANKKMWQEISEKSMDDFIKLCEESTNEWTPYCKQPPLKTGEYLVTTKDVTYVELVNFANDLSMVDEQEFHNEKRCGFYIFDDEYNCYLEVCDVIAWMPAPQPYKAKSEVKNETTK